MFFIFGTCPFFNEYFSNFVQISFQNLFFLKMYIRAYVNFFVWLWKGGNLFWWRFFFYRIFYNKIWHFSIYIFFSFSNVIQRSTYFFVRTYLTNSVKKKLKIFFIIYLVLCNFLKDYSIVFINRNVYVLKIFLIHDVIFLLFLLHTRNFDYNLIILNINTYNVIVFYFSFLWFEFVIEFGDLVTIIVVMRNIIFPLFTCIDQAISDAIKCYNLITIFFYDSINKCK